jgi:hypothetical protein
VHSRRRLRIFVEAIALFAVLEQLNTLVIICSFLLFDILNLDLWRAVIRLSQQPCSAGQPWILSTASPIELAP